MNGWEGWTKDSKEWCSFHVSGPYIQDLRESRSSKRFVSPDVYRAKDSTEGKKIAEDIFNGENLEVHEANRKAQIAEDEKTAKLIGDVDKLIKKLSK